MNVLAFLESLRRVRETLDDAAMGQRGTARNRENAAATFHVAEPDPQPCRCGRYYVESFTVNHWIFDPASGRLEFSERVRTIGRVTPAEKDRWHAGHQSRCVDPACDGFSAPAHSAPSLDPGALPQPFPAKEGEAAL